jgi:signal peptidase I
VGSNDVPIVYRRSRSHAIRSWIGSATTWAIGLTLAVVLAIILIFLTGRARMVPILSGSMEPRLPSGGLMIVTPIAASGVQPGDIIVYSIPIGDRHVEAHRILQIVSSGDHPVVITKGDANEAADPWEARLDGPIVWKARIVVPGIMGDAIAFLRPASTQMLMLTAAALLLLAVGLRWLWAADPSPEGIIERATPSM